MELKLGLTLTENSGRTIRAESILGIASIMIILGSLAPWRSVAGMHVNALHSWSAKAAFAGGLIALFGTTVNYRIYRSSLLQRYAPFTDAGLGSIGSILALVGSSYYWYALEAEATPSWGLFITMIGSLIGVFSAFGVYKQEISPIPKGMSESKESKHGKGKGLISETTED